MTWAIWLALSAALPDLAVTTEPCLEAEAPEIRRLLSLEVKAPVEAGGPAATQVRLSCSGSTVSIEVMQPDRPLRRARYQLRGSAQAVRARVLALAVAEVVRDLSGQARPARRPRQRSSADGEPSREGEAASAAAEVPPDAEPSPLVLEPVEEPSPPVEGEGQGWRRLLLGAQGGARYGGGAAQGSARVVALLGYRLDERGTLSLLLRLDVGYSRGGFTLAQGGVRLDAADGALGVQLALGSRAVRVRGGLGWRLGAAWLTGVPSDPAAFVGLTESGAVTAPALQLGLDAAFGRLWLGLDLEGGSWLRGLIGQVDGAAAVRVEGLYGAIGATVGVAL